MPRSNVIRIAGLASLAFFAVALPATAGTLPADALPIPNRVALAEVIVVGKVKAIEDKTVMVAPYPGATNKVEFKVAVVALSDALLTPRKVTTVRLGFVVIPPMVFISPTPFQAVEGQEGCYFLTSTGEADLLVPAGPLGFIDRKSPTFDKDIALVKRCTKILDDPTAALKAGDAEERFLAAAMLLARYRTRKGPNAKTELIEAEQSKLILEALAGADWTPTTDFTKLSPLMVLHRLPLTDKDGWAPPKDRTAYPAYAQQWVKEQAGKYRIEKFVTEKNK